MSFKFLVSWLYVSPFALCAQAYQVQKSSIVFFSGAPLENIKSTNSKAKALFELNSAEVTFEVPIKDFEFERDLMKPHFSEKYMDTEGYPKSHREIPWGPGLQRFFLFMHIQG